MTRNQRDYMGYARDVIAQHRTPAKLPFWWDCETPWRDRAGLTADQVKQLRTALDERMGGGK